MGQWGQKAILLMIQVPEMHQFHEVWRPVEASLVWPFLSPPTSGCARQLWHIPRDLRRMLRKAKPALITRARDLGWECLLQGCLQPPDMRCRSGVLLEGSYTEVVTTKWRLQGTKLGTEWLCSFSSTLFFSLWDRAEKEGGIWNKWSDMLFP